MIWGLLQSDHGFVGADMESCVRMREVIQIYDFRDIFRKFISENVLFIYASSNENAVLIQVFEEHRNNPRNSQSLFF